MSKTALIAGASGLVGSYCLEYLLQSKIHDKVICITRKTLPNQSPYLQQIIADANNLAETLSELKADDVYCCIGTTINKAGTQEAFKQVDYTYVKVLAEQLKNNGATSFAVVSSIGADAKSSNFYLRIKGEMENAVKACNYTKTIILRPSMLLGPRKEFRMGEAIGKVFMTTFSFLFVGKLKRYKAIEATQVAKALIHFTQEDFKGLKVVENEELLELKIVN
ncbi:MAG: NAD-dependent epimerase/dehydratase family protein [Bacteroidia bacterium]